MIDAVINGLIRVIETQGIVAGLLLIMMVQNCIERKALMAKNCELNHFLMKLLQQKIDEDSSLSRSSPGSPKPGNFADLPPEGIISHPINKVS